MTSRQKQNEAQNK
jgi:hypothetical protein